MKATATVSMGQPVNEKTHTFTLDEQEYRLLMFVIHARQKDVRKVKDDMPGYDAMSKVDTKLTHLVGRITNQVG